MIGRLMLRSKRQKPCCYLEISADITELTMMRKPYCKEIGVRVTTNDFFYAAIAQAVKEFRFFSGQLDETGDNIYLSDRLGIGFAVAAPQGLVVPVIRDAGRKTLPELARQGGELLKKARSNKLKPDDFYGANIVLSGLGMYGIDTFFAVVPPSASAIISLGKIDEKIVPVNDDLMVRKIMSVSMAADSRIVNEFYAAGFLRRVVDHIEEPLTLTLDREMSDSQGVC